MALHWLWAYWLHNLSLAAGVPGIGSRQVLGLWVCTFGCWAVSFEGRSLQWLRWAPQPFPAIVSVDIQLFGEGFLNGIVGVGFPPLELLSGGGLQPSPPLSGPLRR